MVWFKNRKTYKYWTPIKSMKKESPKKEVSNKSKEILNCCVGSYDKKMKLNNKWRLDSKYAKSI
jgi:hypothetical protein